MRKQNTHCPVAMMATEYAKLTTAFDALDKVRGGTTARQEHIEDRRDAIRLAVSFKVPTSATGAAFILAQAACCAGLLSAVSDEAHKTEMERRALRYHYALWRYLLANGASLPKVIVDYDMPDELDPLS